MYYYAKSKKGYLHAKENLGCQDYSSVYHDIERTIITCCDGHGGKVYIRSNVGAKMASFAIENVLKSLNNSSFRLDEEELENKIKLELLCEWNKLIERKITNSSVKKKELEGLNDDQIELLKNHPVVAYGTTLCGALVYKNKLVVVSIGDCESVLISKGKVARVFDTNDDPAGNITYSMCQDDAYQYLRVKILNFNNYDGIILCTDGVSGPYQSYDNFDKSFIKPITANLLMTSSYTNVSNIVDDIADKVGVGDDVSLAFIIKDKTKKKYYV